MSEEVAAARTGNLPRPVSPLVGRTAELAAVVGLLRRRGATLVTLTGPGGVGKTRLALAAVPEIAPDLPGGIWFVPLAGVRDPELVVPTIANVVGVREVAGHALLDHLGDVFSGPPCLLM